MKMQRGPSVNSFKNAHSSFKSFSTKDNANKTCTCLYTNADQYMNKRSEMLANIDIFKPEVIAITEVKPKHARYSVHESEITVEGYEPFHNLDSKGRGIALLVKKELKPSMCDSLISSFEEHVFVECQLGDGKVLLLGLVYRSPSSTLENSELLNELMRKASEVRATHTMIVGDFNYPDIDWNLEKSRVGPEQLATKFLETTKDVFLIQHQKTPTRFREGEKANTVDLVFTNKEDMIIDIGLEAGLGKSDHFLLAIQFSCSYGSTPKTERFSFHRTDVGILKDKLGNVDWDEELGNATVNEAWCNIKARINAAISSSTPISRSNGRRGKSWMNPSTLAVVRKKHKLFRKWQETRADEDYQAYLRARNQARKACRNAQRDLEKKVAADSKTNPKAFWNYVKSKTSTRTGIADLKNEDGTKTTSDGDKAELLNRFFSSVFTREDGGPVPEAPEFPLTEEILDLEFAVDDVKKQLKELKVGKATGPDGIPPSILVQAAEELAEPLARLFKMSLDTGCVPEDWKMAYVTPIFKKGSRAEASNYRPVSLTSIVCKVMERLVRTRMMEHLTKNDLISKYQHGFVPGRSCMTQLLDVLDTWTDILDDNGGVDVIYMDFQKAFDKVPHRRLIEKLSAHGIRGKVLNWICDFLSNRKQRVVVNGAQSSVADVTSGIPQGSVVGPLLFVVYINDLPQNIKNDVRMFADDTKLYARSDIESGPQTLQEDLQKLEQWSEKWLLKFHPEKCCVLKLGRKSKADYFMGEGETRLRLKESDAERDLGVIVDSKLSFKTQVATSTAKANRVLGLIRRSFDYLSEKTFTQLYKSLVRPLLEYGHCVWQPHLKTLSSDLESVQRRATKLLGHLKETPYPERLQILGLPSLEHRRVRGDMIEVYKYTHNLYKTEKPALPLSTSTQLRGNSLKLQKNRSRLELRANFFSNRVVATWNDLPDAVVNAPSVDAFKRRLDNHWCDLPSIYSPNCID